MTPRIPCLNCGWENRDVSLICCHCGRPMNACPECGRRNRATARFCGHDAVPLRALCTHCGWLNRVGAHFCARCQAPLLALPAPGLPGLCCPKCRAPNRAGARFCSRCQSPLTASPSPQGPRYGTGMIPPQTRLRGIYTVLGRVAQGGQGAVYRVADTNLSMWALKEMSQTAMGTMSLEEQAEAIDAFRREADLLSQLDHPNLCKVVDIFEDRGKQYMVMEFVAGKTLAKLLDEAGMPIEVPHVLEWADQLCQVLAYLHRQAPKIIYRDLKPQNVMEIGGSHDLRLIDFGIVRFFKAGKAKDTRKMGTPGYAPPEQYGKGQTDERSDVYALGATLHHLLTNVDPGNQPFQFTPARDLNRAVPSRVSDALMKAVSHQPEDRFGSADEMREALLGKAKPYVAKPSALPAVPSAPPLAPAAQPGVPIPGPAPKPVPSPPPVFPPAPPGPIPIPSISLTLSGRQLDFGTLARGTTGKRTFRVIGPLGLTGKVAPNVPWITLTPERLTRGGEEVTVQVQTHPLKLARGTPVAVPNLLARIASLVAQGRGKGVPGVLMLLLVSPVLLVAALGAALGQGVLSLAAAHARHLVPASRSYQGEIQVQTDSGDDTVQVQVTVEPTQQRIKLGWVLVAAAMVLEAVALALLILWIAGLS
jgi:serine/threonine-protein kinase